MQDTAVIKKLYKSLKATQARLTALERIQRADIAVIGMACRFPAGADTPDRFWQLLLDEVDAVGTIPASRWQAADYYDADPGAPGKMYTDKGAFLREDVSLFDAGFFGIEADEARSLDPQQRLLLEVSWEALENAALPIADLKGTRTSVYAGVSNYDYVSACWRGDRCDKIDAHAVTGTTFSTASGRLSYLYGFEGPALTLDTACSSSLVATHLACQSLRNNEADMALAGGVNLILSPETHISFSKLKVLSPDGHCKSFDATANGYARGEGCGFVVLKRLDDAVRDGDPVLAVIKGTAMNQDGKSNGLTSPNGLAQQSVVRKALQSAGVTAGEVDFVEAHGTGTLVGDPIEVDALAQVYGAGRQVSQPLVIGSVKANIGHLESAASMASLIKTVLSVKHGVIPAQIHLSQPNPQIPWQELCVYPATRQQSWPEERIRTAGLSSFGFSGTNAHVILQQSAESEATDLQSTPPDHGVLLLSAKTEAALKVLAERYVDYLLNTDHRLADICFTSALGRSHHKLRLALSGDKTMMISALKSYLDGDSSPGLWTLSSDSQLATNEAEQHAINFCHQQAVDWRKYYADSGLIKVVLPNYPFQRIRHWMELALPV